MIFVKNIGPEFFSSLHELCVAAGYAPHEYFVPHIGGGLSMSPVFTEFTRDGESRMIIGGVCTDSAMPMNNTPLLIGKVTRYVEMICDTFNNQLMRDMNSFLHGGEANKRKLVNGMAYDVADFDRLKPNTVQIVHVNELGARDPLIYQLEIEYSCLKENENIKIYGATNNFGLSKYRYFDIKFKVERVSTKKSEAIKPMTIAKVTIERADI